jgi:hypothetical protein
MPGKNTSLPTGVVTTLGGSKTLGAASSSNTSANAGGLSDILKSFGIDLSNMPVTPTTGKAAPKSGIYTTTQISSKIPDDLAIKDNVNSVFQQYYGRDAHPDELAIWIPALKNKYKSKAGKTQTTIKSTYQNGNLVRTEYLTADNLDPKMWLQDQIKTKLAAGKTTVNTAGIPEGPSGKYFVALKDLARSNGINLSDAAATDYSNKIIAGVLDVDTVYNTIRESAASAFPQFADKIKSGINLQTLADPYIQSMSKILELPDASIDLFDPKIRGALSYTMPDGKLGIKSIYDFERELRQDPRWQYTNNAREDVSNSVTQVLQDFGFKG